MASRTARIVASTVAPILLTGGIAVAASKSGDDPSTTTTPSAQNGQPPQGQPPQGPPMGRPPGPPGPGMDRNLTFAELHVRKDGKDVVIRLERG